MNSQIILCSVHQVLPWYHFVVSKFFFLLDARRICLGSKMSHLHTSKFREATWCGSCCLFFMSGSVPEKDRQWAESTLDCLPQMTKSKDSWVQGMGQRYPEPGCARHCLGADQLLPTYASTMPKSQRFYFWVGDSGFIAYYIPAL